MMSSKHEYRSFRKSTIYTNGQYCLNHAFKSPQSDNKVTQQMTIFCSLWTC